MNVEIITMAGCPRCLLLKLKLGLLGVSYTELGAVGGIALEGKKLPITIIEGEPYEYAAALAKLKGMKRAADA